MNKNLFLSQEERHSEESPLIYKWAKPVTTLKAKRDTGDPFDSFALQKACLLACGIIRWKGTAWKRCWSVWAAALSCIQK